MLRISIRKVGSSGSARWLMQPHNLILDAGTGDA